MKFEDMVSHFDCVSNSESLDVLRCRWLESKGVDLRGAKRVVIGPAHYLQKITKVDGSTGYQQNFYETARILLTSPDDRYEWYMVEFDDGFRAVGVAYESGG